MEPFRDDRLIADLQSLRPTPRPQFAAELDERAAAGFPRRSRLSLPSFERVRPGGLLTAAGTVALVAIAIATAFAVSRNSGQGPGAEVAVLRPEERHHAAPAAPAPGGSAGTSSGPSGVVYGAESSALPTGAVEAEGPSYGPADAAAVPRTSHREVERSAEIILAADPKDIDDDASRVFEAVHAHNGIVMRSSTQEGHAGEAGATFELLIPSARLTDAMAAFSEIDAVRSRHEATADITAPTVGAVELLRQSRSRIDSLLAQLEAAESAEEQEAIEAELRHERRHAARLAAQLSHLHKRADFSRVSLRIETVAEESSAAAAWGVDDALRDAGHVLTVAAAFTLIALAVLGPVALIALLAWLTHRAWVRRERRRVLS